MIRRLLQAAVVVVVMAGVWLISVDRRSVDVPVLPATGTAFSLDMSVIDSADHELVYAVEQRARPYYRVFSFDPRTGVAETVFTVPEDAIISSIALSPDRSQLAVAYSPDFKLDGNGIWLLDLAAADGGLAPFVEIEAGRYLTDLIWSTGGALLATQVDQQGTGDEELSVASFSLAGDSAVLVADAINPVMLDGDLYFLTVDEQNARHAVGHLTAAGERSTIEIGDSTNDLDHLVIADGSLLVAALVDENGGFSIGTPASAHGSHDVLSAWWEIDPTGETEPTITELEPAVTYDAAGTASAVVSANLEGLSIGDTKARQLIKSRAIRMVAG